MELRIVGVLILGWNLEALDVDGFPWEEKGLSSELSAWQGL